MTKSEERMQHSLRSPRGVKSNKNLLELSLWRNHTSQMLASMRCTCGLKLVDEWGKIPLALCLLLFSEKAVCEGCKRQWGYFAGLRNVWSILSIWYKYSLIWRHGKKKIGLVMELKWVCLMIFYNKICLARQQLNDWWLCPSKYAIWLALLLHCLCLHACNIEYRKHMNIASHPVPRAFQSQRAWNEVLLNRIKCTNKVYNTYNLFYLQCFQPSHSTHHKSNPS